MSYNKEVAGDNNATNACTGLKDCVKEMCRCMRKEHATFVVYASE